MKTVVVEYLPENGRRASYAGEIIAETSASDDIFHQSCAALKAKGLRGRVQFVRTSYRIIAALDVEEGANQREYRDPNERWKSYWPWKPVRFAGSRKGGSKS